MSFVVFLRAVNVGGANLCRPAALAKQLNKFGVVNIGAVGTFVVRENVSEAILRKEFAAQLAKAFRVKCEIMICPARDIIKLATEDPFSRQPSGPDVVRFVSVLRKRPSKIPRLPVILPPAAGAPLAKSSHARSDLHQTSNIEHQTSADWVLKIVAIQDQFVLGVYRRQMKAISYLGKIEKILGVPATTRNWNTIQTVVQILKAASPGSTAARAD